MSWYNQHVKWPFDRQKSRMDPAAFLTTIEDFHWLDYERLLARWSTVLGRSASASVSSRRARSRTRPTDVLARLGVDPARPRP